MEHTLKPRRVAVLALLALFARGASATAPSAQPVAPHRSADARFAPLEHEYVTYLLGAYPVVATYLGGAAFDPALAGIDGTLRDVSPAALEREDARLAQFRARFTALAPARLGARRRIDRSVALAQITFLLHAHQVRRLPLYALDSYVVEPVQGITWQLEAMNAGPSAAPGTEAQWRAVLARLRAVPAYLATAQQQLAAGVAAHLTPDWRVAAEFGLRSSAANADYLGRSLPQLAAAALADPAHEGLLRELQAAGNDAAAAYRGLRTYVARTFFEDAEDADADEAVPRAAYRADRFAIGAAEYDWALRNNLRTLQTAATLYAGSASVIEATRAKLVALARQVATAHNWGAGTQGDETVRAVFAQLGQMAPRTDAEMLEGYRQVAARLVAYGRGSGLFTVPADYRLGVVLTPPWLRERAASAAFYAPPPFGRPGPGRLTVTPTDDDVAQLRAAHRYASMPDVIAHQGFPGHGWQYHEMLRYRGEISPLRWLTPGAVEDSGAMWQDSMSLEGWALYAEALLGEARPGAPHGAYTAEEHLYELRAELARQLQLRIDIGLHTARLGFEEAVTRYSEEVDFLPGACSGTPDARSEAKQASCNAARREVLRCALWPTQAVTYGLGREEILVLRRRAERLLGVRYSAPRFELELLRQGTIPTGYFAEELLHALRAGAP